MPDDWTTTMLQDVLRCTKEAAAGVSALSERFATIEGTTLLGCERLGELDTLCFRCHGAEHAQGR